MRLQAPGFRFGAAFSATFSPSGRFLAQVGRRVRIYDVAKRKPVVSSQWHYPHAAAAAFSPSDAWLAIRSTTGAIVVVDPVTGHPHSRLPPESETADDSSILAGPDGSNLVEASASGTLRVRRVTDLGVEFAEQHPAYLLGPVSCSTARDRWALAFNRRQLEQPAQPDCHIEIRTWPLTGAHRWTLSSRFGFIHALALSPGGERVAVLERLGNSETPVQSAISILQSVDGTVVKRVTGGQWKAHGGFAWSPDGRWLIVGTDDGHQLLDSELAVIGSVSGEYSSDASFSPDGRLLALGYWGHGLVIPVEQLMAWFSQVPASDPDAV